MNVGILKKIKIIVKAIRIFKNWYLYPIVYFKLTNHEHVIFKTKNGLKIKLRVNSTDLMALTNVWLKQEYSKNDFEINDSDVVIDIGAHIGLFSIFASKFCRSGKIYCFEPVKENYELLLSNLKLNKITNVIPFNSAISKETSFVEIFCNDDEAGHSMYQPTSKSIKVKSIPLQKLFEDKNIEKCDFLKLDCEGAEYDIIDSLPIEYFKKIKKIVIEYHFADNKPELLQNLKKRLELLDFKIYIKEVSSDMGIVYAINLTVK